MPNMVNGLSHQPWRLKERVVNFPFNHINVRDLILSNTWITEQVLSVKSLLFLSFQISQTVANQMTCKIDCLTFE